MTGLKKKLAGFLVLLLFLFGTGLCEIPDFKQGDPRWVGIMYSNHGDPEQTIKKGGCGLCAIANVIAYWFDPAITPVEIAALSVRTGHCTDKGGTYITFNEDITQYYPLRVIKSADIADAIKCLESGGLVVAVMSGGVWNQKPTTRHAVTIYAHVDGDIYLHDPAWLDPFMSQIIGHTTVEKMASSAEWYYCYWK